MPSPARGVSAAAIQIGREIVLFDCGEGTQRQFMLSQVSFMKVNKIFISHFHGDHFLGLPGLIQSMNFSGRKTPLQIYGPEGAVEVTRSCLNLGYFSPQFEIYAGDLEAGDMIDYGNYRIKAVGAEHTVPALAYVLEESPRRGRFLVDKARELGVREGPMFARLQSGETVEVSGRTITPDMVMGPSRRGRKIVYSGDTRPNSEVIDAARGADVLIHEATLDQGLEEGAKEYGHSTAKEAAQVAVEAGVDSLYLTHISNRYEDPSILEAEAKAIFPRTKLAEDFMTFTVRLKDRSSDE
jgi:ribonuclease Z